MDELPTIQCTRLMKKTFIDIHTTTVRKEIKQNGQFIYSDKQTDFYRQRYHQPNAGLTSCNSLPIIFYEVGQPRPVPLHKYFNCFQTQF